MPKFDANSFARSCGRCVSAAALCTVIAVVAIPSFAVAQESFNAVPDKTPRASSQLGRAPSICNDFERISLHERQSGTTARLFKLVSSQTKEGEFGRWLETNGYVETTGACQGDPTSLLLFIYNNKIDDANKVAAQLFGGGSGSTAQGNPKGGPLTGGTTYTEGGPTSDRPAGNNGGQNGGPSNGSNGPPLRGGTSGTGGGPSVVKNSGGPGGGIPGGTPGGGGPVGPPYYGGRAPVVGPGAGPCLPFGKGGYDYCQNPAGTRLPPGCDCGRIQLAQKTPRPNPEAANEEKICKSQDVYIAGGIVSVFHPNDPYHSREVLRLLDEPNYITVTGHGAAGVDRLGSNWWFDVGADDLARLIHHMRQRPGNAQKLVRIAACDSADAGSKDPQHPTAPLAQQVADAYKRLYSERITIEGFHGNIQFVDKNNLIKRLSTYKRTWFLSK